MSLSKTLVLTTAAAFACGFHGLPANGQSLQESLDDLEVGDRWEYNEWEAAQAAAAESGKPILALFR